MAEFAATTAAVRHRLAPRLAQLSYEHLLEVAMLQACATQESTKYADALIAERADSVQKDAAVKGRPCRLLQLPRELLDQILERCGAWQLARLQCCCTDLSGAAERAAAAITAGQEDYARVRKLAPTVGSDIFRLGWYTSVWITAREWALEGSGKVVLRFERTRTVRIVSAALDETMAKIRNAKLLLVSRSTNTAEFVAAAVVAATSCLADADVTVAALGLFSVWGASDDSRTEALAWHQLEHERRAARTAILLLAGITAPVRHHARPEGAHSLGEVARRSEEAECAARSREEWDALLAALAHCIYGDGNSAGVKAAEQLLSQGAAEWLVRVVCRSDALRLSADALESADSLCHAMVVAHDRLSPRVATDRTAATVQLAMEVLRARGDEATNPCRSLFLMVNHSMDAEYGNSRERAALADIIADALGGRGVSLLLAEVRNPARSHHVLRALAGLRMSPEEGTGIDLHLGRLGTALRRGDGMAALLSLIEEVQHTEYGKGDEEEEDVDDAYSSPRGHALLAASICEWVVSSGVSDGEPFFPADRQVAAARAILRMLVRGLHSRGRTSVFGGCLNCPYEAGGPAEGEVAARLLAALARASRSNCEALLEAGGAAVLVQAVEHAILNEHVRPIDMPETRWAPGYGPKDSSGFGMVYYALLAQIELARLGSRGLYALRMRGAARALPSLLVEGEDRGVIYHETPETCHTTHRHTYHFEALQLLSLLSDFSGVGNGDAAETVDSALRRSIRGMLAFDAMTLYDPTYVAAMSRLLSLAPRLVLRERQLLCAFVRNLLEDGTQDDATKGHAALLLAQLCRHAQVSQLLSPRRVDGMEWPQGDPTELSPLCLALEFSTLSFTPHDGSVTELLQGPFDQMQWGSDDVVLTSWCLASALCSGWAPENEADRAFVLYVLADPTLARALLVLLTAVARGKPARLGMASDEWLCYAVAYPWSLEDLLLLARGMAWHPSHLLFRADGGEVVLGAVVSGLAGGGGAQYEALMLLETLAMDCRSTPHLLRSAELTAALEQLQVHSSRAHLVQRVRVRLREAAQMRRTMRSWLKIEPRTRPRNDDKCEPSARKKPRYSWG